MTKTAAGFSLATNPYRYTAKRLDTGSVTLDMGARRYSASTGRFLQRDGFNGALANLVLAADPMHSNRYLFTGANPISYVEIDGHVFGTANLLADFEGVYDPMTQAIMLADGYDRLGCAENENTNVCGGLESGAKEHLQVYENGDDLCERSLRRDYCSNAGWKEAVSLALAMTDRVGLGSLAKAGFKTSAKQTAKWVTEHGIRGAGAPVYRSFTRRNFRENRARRTSGIPEGAEAHHVLPQKFADQFETLGININDPRFGAWWERGAHRRASAAYNREWQEFLRTDPSRGEVLGFGRQIAQRYGLRTGF